MGVNTVADKNIEIKNSIYETKAQRKTNGDLDKNAFLYILTTQLGNQDPTNAKDNTEYIAQLAQFSALEQMQNLNTTMSKMFLADKVGQGTVLVGHEVTFDTGKTNVVVHQDASITEEPVLSKEVVKSAKIEKGEVYLITTDKNNKQNKYSLDTIIEVGDYQNVSTAVEQPKVDTKLEPTKPTGEQVQGTGEPAKTT